jgi:hypothetical protein
MLGLARRRAEELGRAVDLREADAHALPFPDACFDTVVCTFSLCAIPDERRGKSAIRLLGHSRTSFTDATHVLLLPEAAKAAAESAAAMVPRRRSGTVD